MRRSNLMAHFMKHVLWSALLGATTILAGCTTMPMQQNLVARDILEIKTKLDKTLEQQSAENRKLEYSLSSINEKLDGRTDSMQTVLDDLTKQQRKQMEELEKIRAMVEGIGIRSTGAGAVANAGPAPLDSGQPVTPAPTTAVQAIANANQQLQAGRFNEAREGFRTALGLNPTPDQKVFALYGLGESLYQINDLQAALQSFNDLISLQPAHPKAWASVERIGDIRAKLNDKANALAAYQLIVDKYPQYPAINQVKTKINEVRGGGAPQAAPQQPAPQGAEFQ